MKFTLFLSLVAAVTAVTNKKLSSIKAGSSAGQNLISSSRNLEDNFDEVFVATHSILFQECHQSSSWTEDGYMQVDMIRYILCPTDSCSDSACSSSSYGEYVVDMATFVDAYMEYQMEALEYKCESMREQCGCEDDNSAYCLYYCFKDSDDNSWAQCGDVEEEERLGECQRLEIDQDDDNRRHLGSDDGDDEYFMGPYCSDDGTGIFMTLFADEDCSVKVNDAASIYYTAAGTEMPYKYVSGSTGMIDTGCLSCLEQQNAEDQNDDDAEDEDQVSRLCEETYEAAAKCETDMTDMYYYYRVIAGCTYIDSLKNGNGSTAYSSAMSARNNVGYLFACAACVALIVGAVALTIRKKRRDSSKAAPLVEAELSPQQYSAMS